MARILLFLLPFCLRAAPAAGNPLPTMPTPPPLSTGNTTTAAPSAAGTAAARCTTWMTSLEYGFRGENFSAKAVRTVYTSTQIIFTHVPCGGCLLEIKTTRAAAWGGIGPEVEFTATVTAVAPASATSTVCLAEGDAPKMQIPGGAPVEKQDTPTATASSSSSSSASASVTVAPPLLPPTTPLLPNPTARGSECTSTHVSAVQATWGPLRTVWTSTVTSTSHVDCGGCPYVTKATLNGLHPGPRVKYTETVTASTPTTVVDLVCIKTPSVVGGPGGSSPTNTLPIQRTKRGVEVVVRETRAVAL